MKTGLLSIHEEYAEAILDGRKKYEFRTKAPRLDGETKFLIYVPGPKKALVGEMLVSSVISSPPARLWTRTKAKAGIDKDDFMAYFEGRDEAFALVVKKAKRFTKERSLEEMRASAPGGFTPPQFLLWLTPALHTSLVGPRKRRATPRLTVRP